MHRPGHVTLVIALILAAPAAVRGQEQPGDSPPAATEPQEPPAPAALPASYVETIELFLQDFEMVLVPGSADKDIAPFYIGKHEVTWEIFAPWVQCKDIVGDAKQIIARKRELRPSTPYGSIDRDYGYDGRPALGVSRLNAETYCRWLSEQTGRTYRLPTEAEWERALALGGLDPASATPPEDLDEIAWSASNAWSDELLQPIPQVAGTLKANSLGIHDMLGNVAEWVTTIDDARVVRGGSFWTEKSELSGDDREVETPQWNENYPNEPKSKWWFVDAEHVGFRLVSVP